MQDATSTMQDATEPVDLSSSSSVHVRLSERRSLVLPWTSSIASITPAVHASPPKPQSKPQRISAVSDAHGALRAAAVLPRSHRPTDLRANRPVGAPLRRAGAGGRRCAGEGGGRAVAGTAEGLDWRVERRQGARGRDGCCRADQRVPPLRIACSVTRSVRRHRRPVPLSSRTRHRL
jgi:hypothetical protein